MTQIRMEKVNKGPKARKILYRVKAYRTNKVTGTQFWGSTGFWLEFMPNLNEWRLCQTLGTLRNGRHGTTYNDTRIVVTWTDICEQSAVDIALATLILMYPTVTQ